MEQDCCFTKQKNWFRYRAGGLIVHNDKMLFVKSRREDYFYIMGGGVHIGETSKVCVEREIFEESGLKAKAERLLVVLENFFQSKNKFKKDFDCHTVEFYYYMMVQDISSLKEKTDNGESLVWLSLDNIEQYNIKPGFIKHRIRDIIKSEHIIHIIEESDR